MSYHSYAYVFRGIKVHIDRMYTKRKTRGCEHQFTYGKFCGHCGAPRWVGEDVLIPGFNGDDRYKNLEVEYLDEYAYIGLPLTRLLYEEENEESTVINYDVEVTVKGFDEPVRDYLILTGS